MKSLTSVLALCALVLGLASAGCSGIASVASDADLTAAIGQGARELDPQADSEDHNRAVSNFKTLLSKLRDVPALAPLWDLYQVPNPIVFGSDDESSGLIQLLRAVSITSKSGAVTITNRQTGAVIYSAPNSDLAAGTFYAESMPGGTPTPTACTYAYSAWGTCQSDNTQTRTVVSATPAGCTGTPVLSQSCTPPAPVACTYTTGAWGACQPDGTQTRTVTASPLGCTPGTPPATTQSCTYVPPVVTCTGFTYSNWTACDSTGHQTRTVISATPVGCSGGSPVLSQTCTPPPVTCTSFTYNAWTPATCPSSGVQTRTVATSSPAGCTGGTPVLTQTCTYVPPVCTSFTYSAWSTCSASGTQTRTVISSSPAGCTGGTPVLSQSCTPPPTNPVTFQNVVSSCTGCHGLTSNTTVFKSGGYTVSGRSASQWLSTVNNMVGRGASLASGTTAQNYADYLAGVP